MNGQGAFGVRRAASRLKAVTAVYATKFDRTLNISGKLLHQLGEVVAFLAALSSLPSISNSSNELDSKKPKGNASTSIGGDLWRKLNQNRTGHDTDPEEDILQVLSVRTSLQDPLARFVLDLALIEDAAAAAAACTVQKRENVKNDIGKHQSQLAACNELVAAARNSMESSTASQKNSAPSLLAVPAAAAAKVGIDTVPDIRTAFADLADCKQRLDWLRKTLQRVNHLYAGAARLRSQCRQIASTVRMHSALAADALRRCLADFNRLADFLSRRFVSLSEKFLELLRCPVGGGRGNAGGDRNGDGDGGGTDGGQENASSVLVASRLAAGVTKLQSLVRGDEGGAHFKRVMAQIAEQTHSGLSLGRGSPGGSVGSPTASEAATFWFVAVLFGSRGNSGSTATPKANGSKAAPTRWLMRRLEQMMLIHRGVAGSRLVNTGGPRTNGTNDERSGARVLLDDDDSSMYSDTDGEDSTSRPSQTVPPLASLLAEVTETIVGHNANFDAELRSCIFHGLLLPDPAKAWRWWRERGEFGGETNTSSTATTATTSDVSHPPRQRSMSNSLQQKVHRQRHRQLHRQRHRERRQRHLNQRMASGRQSDSETDSSSVSGYDSGTGSSIGMSDGRHRRNLSASSAGSDGSQGVANLLTTTGRPVDSKFASEYGQEAARCVSGLQDILRDVDVEDADFFLELYSSLGETSSTLVEAADVLRVEIEHGVPSTASRLDVAELQPRDNLESEVNHRDNKTKTSLLSKGTGKINLHCTRPDSYRLGTEVCALLVSTKQLRELDKQAQLAAEMQRQRLEEAKLLSKGGKKTKKKKKKKHLKPFSKHQDEQAEKVMVGPKKLNSGTHRRQGSYDGGTSDGGFRSLALLSVAVAESLDATVDAVIHGQGHGQKGSVGTPIISTTSSKSPSVASQKPDTSQIGNHGPDQGRAAVAEAVIRCDAAASQLQACMKLCLQLSGGSSPQERTIAPGREPGPSRTGSKPFDRGISITIPSPTSSEASGNSTGSRNGRKKLSPTVHKAARASFGRVLGLGAGNGKDNKPTKEHLHEKEMESHRAQHKEWQRVLDYQTAEVVARFVDLKLAADRGSAQNAGGYDVDQSSDRDRSSRGRRLDGDDSTKGTTSSSAGAIGRAFATRSHRPRAATRTRRASRKTSDGAGADTDNKAKRVPEPTGSSRRHAPLQRRPISSASHSPSQSPSRRRAGATRSPGGRMKAPRQGIHARLAKGEGDDDHQAQGARMAWGVE